VLPSLSVRHVNDERAARSTTGPDEDFSSSVLAEPHPQGGRLYGVSDAGAFTPTSAQHLRAAAARYPDDPGVSELVGEFLAGSAAFTRLWASHDVSIEPALCKTFQHPLVGLVTVNCDVLDITDRDQGVVIYTAAPGVLRGAPERLPARMGGRSRLPGRGGFPRRR
jgi:hypothetical protein